MATIVQKYGGSSLADLELLARVAERVVATRREGWDVLVVVSAMGGTTDLLLQQATALGPDPSKRELDVLLSTGEQVSTALLAIAIRGLGEEAVSLTAEQCGIVTNEVHFNARILEVRYDRLRRELDLGRIVVAPGFQGTSREGERTTLGRGGSDTTAVALAAALDAERCEIYTDVDGVYTADPRVIPAARLLAEVPYPVMQELAWQGAKVLKAEAVEFAHQNGLATVVRSSQGADGGTRLLPDGPRWVPRRPAVAGVSGRRDLVRLRLAATWTVPEARARLFETIGGCDLVFAGVREGGGVQLYLSDLEMPDLDFLGSSVERATGVATEIETGLGAVSLVGFGLGSRPQALLQAASILEQRGIAILDMYTSRESLCFVTRREEVDHGVREVHRALLETPEVERRPPRLEVVS